MAEYGNVKILLDSGELGDDSPKLLRPTIISQGHASSDLFLLIGKINSPQGFVSEICIQVWGQDEPISRKYEATFAITRRASAMVQHNTIMPHVANYTSLKLDVSAKPVIEMIRYLIHIESYCIVFIASPASMDIKRVHIGRGKACA